MSHNRPHIRLIQLLAFSLAAVVLNCARLGEASVVFSEQNVLPAQQVVTTVTKPGMGASGGPITWDFWVKNRTAASDAMLGSFAPFYRLSAKQIALSQHFVLYRETGSNAMIPSTVVRTGVTTNLSQTVSSLSQTSDLAVGMSVTGTGIPVGTFIQSVTDATSIVLNNNATSTGAPVLTFSAIRLRTGNTVNSSQIVTGLSMTSDLTRDMKVTGTGIPSDTCIQSITNGSTIVLNNSASITAASILTFTPGADAVLCTMERAYANMKNIYGAGEHPYTNDGARVVILAYNIQDDYATTQNYVGGYFSPRDLYSNDFTQKLYTDPVALQQYSGLIGQLGGYSNEMSIINYDLNPGYSGNPAQVNDIVIHELSHLFTYSKRVVKQRLINHDLWIAEGIAENAPHQTINTASVEALRLTQLASPSVIDYYQDAPQLTDFLPWASKIVGYLQSNLFFSYLRHRAEIVAAGSAATMLAELVMQQDQSVTGVDTLIQKYLPGSNFSAIYGDFVITHYLMMLGIPVADTNGINGAGSNLQTTYSFSKVNIGSSSSTVDGTVIKSKYSATIPYNFEAPRCADGSYGLKPNSYVIFRYRHDGSDRPTNDVAGAGAVSGELPLRYVINLRTEAVLMAASPPATILLTTYDAGQVLPFSSLGTTYSWVADGVNNDHIHILVYNPNKTGSCRQLDNNLIRKRNHSKWVGSSGYGTQPIPDFDWQSDTGASWANSQNGGYYRPSGIAAYASGAPNNFLYITDYVAMSLQKLNMDTGTAMGRLGSTSNTCPTTGNPWDTFTNRYKDGFCAHNFDAPQGVHVDSSHNIYVADSNNRRIVKYDSAGNFVAWLGLYGVGNDGWQTDPATVTDPSNIFNAGALTDTRLFFVPWALTSDATYLYVVDYGACRIVRRNRATGAFDSYIGNGMDGWNTSTSGTGACNSGAGYFNLPRGITLYGSYLYVADEINHRIVRVFFSTGVADGWLGDGSADWKPMGTLPSGAGSSNNKAFKNPSSVTTDGTHLYVADRNNNRIVKWRMDSLNCATPARSEPYCGWIGHGKVGWENTQNPPATDPYYGVSYYPPDYYTEPHGLVYVGGTTKSTKRDYLYVTSVYNGRVTRINIGCVNAPGSASCDPNYDPYGAPYSP